MRKPVGEPQNEAPFSAEKKMSKFVKLSLDSKEKV